MKGSAVLFIALVAVSTVSSEPVTSCSVQGQLIADDERCDIFYKCAYGTAYPQYCPAEEEYDPELQYCDYVKVGGCKGNGTVTQPSTDPDTRCSSQPGAGVTIVQFPNPESCDSFYKCNDKGEAVLIPCPDGLEYNTVAQVCDYPASAHCKVSKI